MGDWYWGARKRGTPGSGAGYAGDHEGKCTLATLKGQYLFAGSAMLFPPASGIPEGTPPSVGSSAGYHIFNGDGTGMDFVTFTLNGVDQHVPSPVLITYTLNHDCTGTYSVQNGPNFDIFVAFDGSQRQLSNGRRASSTLTYEPTLTMSGTTGCWKKWHSGLMTRTSCTF
jgi:hypothetical protein